MVKVRDVTMKTVHYFQKYIPGYEDAYLLQIAEQIGIRESRRITGDYILTGEDAIAGRSFSDVIGCFGGVVDIHNEEGGKEITRMTPIQKHEVYQVPYRVLLAKGINGLMMVGRCISTDRVANGSIRQQAGCILTGQAAGTAAAIAVKTKKTPRDIDIKTLQETLKKQNVILSL
jgi:hypothetical protein